MQMVNGSPVPLITPRKRRRFVERAAKHAPTLPIFPISQVPSRIRSRINRRENGKKGKKQTLWNTWQSRRQKEREEAGGRPALRRGLINLCRRCIEQSTKIGTRVLEALLNPKRNMEWNNNVYEEGVGRARARQRDENDRPAPLGVLFLSSSRPRSPLGRGRARGSVIE